LALEAALFPIAIQFAPTVTALVGTFSLVGGFLSVLAILSISDSIHFYSKFAEYEYMWTNVHEEAYPNKRNSKVKASLKGALDADDIGYYFIRLSLLMLSYALFSFSALLGYPLFVLSLAIPTIFLPLTYGFTHDKDPATAFKDYFFTKRLFPKKGIPAA
jgi:hypothetical protein